MKFILIVLFSLNLFALNIQDINNSHLMKVRDTSSVVLIKFNSVLNRIIKDNNFKKIESKKELIQEKILKDRILANKSQGNALAVKRDLLKLKQIEDLINFKILINNLINLRENLSSKEKIVSFLNYYKKKFSHLNLKRIEGNGIIVNAYNKNLKEYNKQKKKIKYTTLFLENNIDKLVRTNAIINFKIIYISNYINNLPFVRQINIYLTYFFGIDIGKIFLTIIFIFCLIIMKYVFLPLFVKFINKIIIHKNEDLSFILNKTFNQPTNMLIIAISINILVDILFPEFSVYKSFQIFMKIYYLFISLWTLNRTIGIFIESYSEDILNKYPDIRKELILFLKRVFTVILTLIFISLALTMSGVKLTAILGGVGFIGLGASLAFKDTFSNFLGTVNLIFDQPFSVGDWIAVEKVEGTVIEVGMRKTRIRGFANNEFSIPNATLSNVVITNWSRRKIGRRIKFKLGLTYDSPRDKLEKVVEQIRTMLEENDNISNRSLNLNTFRRKSPLLLKEDDRGIKKTLLVYIDELNDFSIDILVYCFTKTTIWEEWLKIKQEVILEIMNIVEKNGLEFAFPTQTIELEKKLVGR